MHGCNSRGFERNSLEITNQRTMRMLCRTWWLHTKSYGMQYESEIYFCSPTWIFSQKSRQSQWEPGEKLHQDITATEKRYQGMWTSSMLADYCWTLKRDVPDAKYRRKLRVSLSILEEIFCLFHEHVQYYFVHLNSSVSLKPCLIETFCIHIRIQHKNTAKFTYWSLWDKTKS